MDSLREPISSAREKAQKAVSRMQEQAAEIGTDALTPDEIEVEISAARRERKEQQEKGDVH